MVKGQLSDTTRKLLQDLQESPFLCRITWYDPSEYPEHDPNDVAFGGHSTRKEAEDYAKARSKMIKGHVEVINQEVGNVLSTWKNGEIK